MNRLFWLGALAAAFLGLGSAGTASANCVLNPIVELHATMEGRKALVDTKINGAPARFAIDSGAFYSSITEAAAHQFALPLDPAPWNFTVTGVGGETTPDLTTVRTFTLANTDLPRIQFLVTPAPAGGSAGLIGQNVLGIGDVEYYLGAGVIRIFKPQGCGGVPLAYWAQGKPYSMLSIEPLDRSRHTTGRVYVNGVAVKAYFDTGAGNSVISRAAAERAGVKLDGPGVRSTGATFGIGPHQVRTWNAPIATFKVGDEEIRNTRLEVADMELGEADMLLGADFFLSHRVYVANSQYKLYFTYVGGPVFNLSSTPLVQATPDQTPQASPTAAPEADPKDAEGFSRRGAAFATRRDFKDAIADFDRAVALEPKEAKYVYQRALAKLQIKDADGAGADLDQALQLDPDDAEALITRAEFRLARHKREDALADLRNAERLTPKEADARLRLGQLNIMLDQLDAAVADFTDWIDSHGEDGRRSNALNGRCWARALLGVDLDKAERDCDAALRTGLKNPSYLDSRGLVHLRKGELDRAIADYDAALALQPKLAWALYGRGVAKTKKGLSAEGAADIAAAAAIRPALADEAKAHGITP